MIQSACLPSRALARSCLAPPVRSCCAWSYHDLNLLQQRRSESRDCVQLLSCSSGPRHENSEAGRRFSHFLSLAACFSRLACASCASCGGRGTMRHESLTHLFGWVGVQDVCFKAVDQGAVPTKMCIRFSVNSCQWQVSAGQSLDSIASLFGSNYVQVCL